MTLINIYVTKITENNEKHEGIIFDLIFVRYLLLERKYFLFLTIFIHTKQYPIYNLINFVT
jgi:hypothetical protein